VPALIASAETGPLASGFHEVAVPAALRAAMLLRG
jgi:hypothetical protein